MKPVIVMTQTNEVHSHLVDIIHKPFIQLKQLHFNEKLLDHSYDWLIFSSKNAVKYFYPYLKNVKVKKVAVIGDKTAEYCNELGISVDFVPRDFSQEGFLDEFKISEQHLLLPSSEKARPKLVQQLSKYNEVAKIDLYRPVPNFKNISQVKSLVRKHQIDAVTFSSSSAVEFYFKGDNVPEFDHYFAIGKQTARTILKFNASVKVANKQTLDSLIDKIIESREQNEI
ncbi:uroporphyrinogen-III synthase [Staphylococcus epidermidis]|jgi:uroporphyrinogen-III synthase|uniref:uroporphyrinogen-III synthase n=1 Tax=Staphylococcus epidermidis TaxID=1282 RepID=UPI00124D064D|nr:uroporphyrinogen-III synthase [Staphylococcus epidermidis]KAB2193338.1 uroporphyrinogen-III synthase [Staphylococcus epidermidis]MBC3168842.1 uroporphyrinogen-III synthase [Staphylococcus epidermidis]MBM0809002.1 uroporphyrinogen-III synthase [Staphylococcus epidermidis]MBM0820348.1 uroporphyrinogen-III synthase [Staphylococcus epidermidis]MBM0822601.1 uroporphyrinogen-III synthase [Staphylococcus epidermidis]